MGMAHRASCQRPSGCLVIAFGCFLRSTVATRLPSRYDLFLLFFLEERLGPPSSVSSSHFPLPLEESKIAPTTSSQEAKLVGMSRSSFMVRGPGALACRQGPCRWSLQGMCLRHRQQWAAQYTTNKMSDVLVESLIFLLPAAREVPWVARAHVCALEVSHEDVL